MFSIILYLLMLRSNTPAKAESQTGETSTQIDSLFAPSTQSDAPGASVSVIRNGKVQHKRGYEMADLEHGVPNTPPTIIRIASITKSFTATAILQLHEEGALNIDDRNAEKYLSDKQQPAEERRLVQIDVDPKIYDDYIEQYRIEAPPEIKGAAGELLTIIKENDRLFGETKMGRVQKKEVYFAGPSELQ